MVRRIKERKERVKKNLRFQGLLKRKTQAYDDIQQKSRIIKEKLFKLCEYKEAKVVMFYVAKFGEVETEEMIKESLKLGKIIVVPKVQGMEIEVLQLLDWNKDLKKGAFGIKEPKKNALRPVTLKEIDLVVLPGICFDLGKNRLGYGRGYFDRFLARLSKKTKSIGLAFESQIIKKIPRFRYDKLLDKVVTEKRIIK